MTHEDLKYYEDRLDTIICELYERYDWKASNGNLPPWLVKMSKAHSEMQNYMEDYLEDKSDKYSTIGLNPKD
tara:strand:- start:422 stop:637 length:216 start_codon:yes stop_codon:yes gene_type:complete